MKYYYRVYGKRISSSEILGDLPRQRPGPVDIEFTFDPREKIAGGVHWFHTVYQPVRDPIAKFGRKNGRFYSRAMKVCDFEFSADGSQVRARLLRKKMKSMIPTVFLSQAIPMALTLKGEAIFHASSVLVNSTAVIFVGRHGFGKSTLATAFAKRGFKLLGDDSAPVFLKSGAPYVFPSIPEIKSEEYFWSKAKWKTAIKIPLKKKKRVLAQEHFWENPRN